MREVPIDDETYDRLLVTARLMEVSVGDVVRRLVTRLTTETAVPAKDLAALAGSREGTAAASGLGSGSPTEWIAIHKVYKGHRMDGTFNPATHEVRLSTAPWINQGFSSPTAAAIAVVEHFSGDVRESPNTNGRVFWKITSTGKNLRSVIGER